jgi:hypothetical protein
VNRKPPPVTTLTYAQKAGWACCFCEGDIWTGAVSAGRALGTSGAHDLSVEVYAHPACLKTEGGGRPQTPARPRTP